MKLQSLTASEEDVMRVIWKEGKIYFRDLINAYPEPKPHQNTISTFLKILVEKNYLNTEKHGRIYLYSPAIGFEDYKKLVTKKFIETYFENSGEDFLKMMMDEKLINANDFSQLFEVKTSVISLQETVKEDPIKQFVNELTGGKKKKKKDKDKKKKKKK